MRACGRVARGGGRGTGGLGAQGVSSWAAPTGRGTWGGFARGGGGGPWELGAQGVSRWATTHASRSGGGSSWRSGDSRDGVGRFRRSPAARFQIEVTGRRSWFHQEQRLPEFHRLAVG